jgi:hypothetical protein
LRLAQFVRDLFPRFDAQAIARLDPLAEERCYLPKFYRAPAIGDEVMAANAYVEYGLKVTPGSILYAFYLPAAAGSDEPTSFAVQLIDQSLNHKFWSEAIPSRFCGNQLTQCQNTGLNLRGSFPKLLATPHPVTGTGLFKVQLWNTSGAQARIELVIGALEAVGE